MIMLKLITRISLSFILLFTLVSCNSATNSADTQQAQESISSESPLGQFLVNSDKPAVIKFYAEWCSTCKKYDPTFKKVSGAMSEAVDFYSVDVDDVKYKLLLKQLKISRIPETVFVNQARTGVSKKLGAIPRVKLEKIITGLLSQ